MFAQVVIESPLPQLDRVFEYEVPKAMQPDVVVGARVLVTIGQSKKPLLGYIVGLMDAPEFQGKTAAISELVTAAPVLNAEIYSLCQQLSQRQAAPLGETLRLAIPTRSVGVEKQYLAEESKDVQAPSRVGSAELQAVLLSARSTFEIVHTPLWAQLIADQAIRDVIDGSVILCMPDAHDLALLRAEFNRREANFIDYSSGQTPSKRYGAFLAAHNASRTIILGNRSALFAPVRDLNAILIWNELDFSHIDQGSPYLNSREIALVRQSIVGCHLRFLSLSLSCDIERLVQLEFLELRNERNCGPGLLTSLLPEREVRW